MATKCRYLVLKEDNKVRCRSLLIQIVEAEEDYLRNTLSKKLDEEKARIERDLDYLYDQQSLFGLAGCDCLKSQKKTSKRRPKGSKKKADQPLSGFKVDQYYFDFIPKAEKKVYGEAKSINKILTMVKQHLESNFVGKSFYNRYT